MYTYTLHFIYKTDNSIYTKLALTIEKEVIDIAKEHAKKKGQSLSEMVVNYFNFVTVKREKIWKNNSL